MIRIRNIVLVCLFITVMFLPLMAQSPEKLTISIALHNKEIYFQDSDIQIAVVIANETSKTIGFKLAESRLFNLDVHVRTMQNQVLSMNNIFLSKRNSSAVYYRDVILLPGESLSFIELLNDYVELSSVGSYVVDFDFYPELYKSPQTEVGIRSNTIMFSLRPGLRAGITGNERLNPIKNRILERADLSPDKIVRYTIEARQKENWEAFFLYLNLEGIYQQGPNRRQQYQRSSEAERVLTLLEFRNDIINGQIDEEISFVPTNFEILETTFTQKKGLVTVLQTFSYGNFAEKKRYAYHFRRNMYWEIVSYEVIHLGTE